MTDRELLELAAKAAGMELDYTIRPDKKAFYHSERNAFALADGGWFAPLTDNNDAFRLMVRLRLEPRFIDNSHSNGAEPSRVTLHNFAGIVENIGDDPAATLRRAITRAAAEIGRQIK